MSTKKKTVARRKPPIYREPEELKLDLGSGPRPAEGFKGCDIAPGQTDYTFDLCSGTKWPFPDSSVDELRSSHFIEHIDAGYVHRRSGPVSKAWVARKGGGAEEIEIGLGPRIDALLFFFDEAFRVAKPGAVFTVQWPALQSARAFQDPTHRRFIPAEMITYLSVDGRESMGVSHYGANCNWIGSVQPTIPIPAETDEDKAMALRADSSDEKQEWAMKRGLEQQRRYQETWNFCHDFIAHLKAVK